jgi:uncharacterized membrane protein YedE/YeeE
MGRKHHVNAALLLFIIFLGASEGYTLYHTGMFLPLSIQHQMLFTTWIIMKVYLGAVGTSMLVQAGLDYFAPGRFDDSRVFKYAWWGYPRVISGGLILGIGMYFSGSGPTILPAQIGAGVTNTVFTFAGAVVGASVFAHFEKWFLSTDTDPKQGQKLCLDQIFNVPYHVLAAPAGVAFLALACGLEYVSPHINDRVLIGLHHVDWTPVIAGIVIGLNQFPIRLIAEHGQGGSTAIMVLVSTATRGKVSHRHMVKGFQQMWQFSFVWIGTLVGALFCAKFVYLDAPPFHGPEPIEGLIGGFLMIFGARIAGGCTCGHGISGVSEFSLESMATTAAIFGGAIGTAVIRQALGL